MKNTPVDDLLFAYAQLEPLEPGADWDSALAEKLMLKRHVGFQWNTTLVVVLLLGLLNGAALMWIKQVSLRQQSRHEVINEQLLLNGE